MLPGGHELLPALMEQQNTVQPDEQLASGPQTAAYAVPGRSMNRHGFNASADPTSVDRNRKVRRRDVRASPPLTTETIFSNTLRATGRASRGAGTPGRAPTENGAGPPRRRRGRTVVDPP